MVAPHSERELLGKRSEMDRRRTPPRSALQSGGLLSIGRGGRALVASALVATAFAAAATAGSYSIHVIVPPQWRHGEVGTVKVVGVAPPKAPYSSSLIVTATKLACNQQPRHNSPEKDPTFVGYVLGGAVSGHFTISIHTYRPRPRATTSAPTSRKGWIDRHHRRSHQPDLVGLKLSPGRYRFT